MNTNSISTSSDDKIIIEGVTEDGKVFRPSDWVDRLCDSAASYSLDRQRCCRGYRRPRPRVYDVPHVGPQMINGTRCLVVNLRLNDTNPQAFRFLMDFAKSNRLRTGEASKP